MVDGGLGQRSYLSDRDNLSVSTEAVLTFDIKTAEGNPGCSREEQ